MKGKPESPAEIPSRVRVSSGVMTGLLRKTFAPIYPQQAREGGIQGTVILHGLIDKAGNVTWITPVTGPPLLVPSAVRAVSHWKYKPYLLNGEPIEVDTTFEVHYKLGG